MKLLLFIAISFSTTLGAQTTDSISTSLGDFVLVSSETVDESTGYSDESATTSDGGTAQMVEINSGARFAAPYVENSSLQVTMQPNPARGIVELNIEGVSGHAEISVTDLAGRSIYTSRVNVDGSRTTYLPTQTWSSGTYVVTVNAGGSLHTERLVVE